MPMRRPPSILSARLLESALDGNPCLPTCSSTARRWLSSLARVRLDALRSCEPQNLQMPPPICWADRILTQLAHSFGKRVECRAPGLPGQVGAA